MVNREYIIEFYNSVLYIPGMPKEKDLTDDILNQLSDTLMFARWMLRIRYNDCINSVKNIIKGLV